MTSTARADSATITDALARSQRRIVAVEFWRGASVALAAAIIAGEVTIIFGTRLLPSVSVRWAIALGLLAAALATAAIRAVLRRPTVRQTASIVDRRLGLADRLVTAVQFPGQEDPYAQLVERDAAARLAGFNAAAALPIETPRIAPAAVLLAIAIPIVFVLTAAWQRRDWTLGISALASRAGLDIAVPSTAGGSITRTAAAPSSSTGVSAARPVPRSGVELSPRPAGTTDARESGRPNTLSMVSQDRNRDGGSGAGPAAASDQHKTSNPSARGGGVAAGALATQLVGQSRANGGGIENTPAYRAAWSRAQSAVAPDRVPADRRVLVKHYFAAIRPSEHE